MKRKVMLSFGALAPPLHEQIECEPHVVEEQQWDADALARLHVRGIITEADVHRARKRLVRSIGEALTGDERDG